MKRLKQMIGHVDLSKKLACHLIGEHHTHIHRKVVGVFIIGIGIVLMEISKINTIIHLMGEVLGVSCHAIEAIPFTQTIEQKKAINHPENLKPCR